MLKINRILVRSDCNYVILNSLGVTSNFEGKGEENYGKMGLLI